MGRCFCEGVPLQAVGGERNCFSYEDTDGYDFNPDGPNTLAGRYEWGNSYTSERIDDGGGLDVFYYLFDQFS